VAADNASAFVLHPLLINLMNPKKQNKETQRQNRFALLGLAKHKTATSKSYFKKIAIKFLLL